MTLLTILAGSADKKLRQFRNGQRRRISATSAPGLTVGLQPPVGLRTAGRGRGGMQRDQVRSDLQQTIDGIRERLGALDNGLAVLPDDGDGETIAERRAWLEKLLSEYEETLRCLQQIAAFGGRREDHV